MADFYTTTQQESLNSSTSSNKKITIIKIQPASGVNEARDYNKNNYYKHGGKKNRSLVLVKELEL